MDSGIICGKCHKGRVIGGQCTNCGAKPGNSQISNALPVGSFLHRGRFRIVRLLGEGGYGITYEALDLLKRRSVAIKEFFPTYLLKRGPNGTDAVCTGANSQKALAHARMRFYEEANLLITLKNKHIKEIVDAYDSFEDNQTAYYTMELLNGMDMQKRLRQYGRMSWQELSPIVIQILRALYATHQEGFIHRDITPDNIFLLENGTVQLIDFGNARKYETSQELTAVVKDKFAPPEQYSRKGKQGPWTDIYSLCVTIYYALTGVLPPKAMERSAQMDELPPLQTVVSVPSEVSKAVDIGMSINENRRYQTVSDFAYAMFPGVAIFEKKQNILHTQNVNQQKRGTMLLCTAGSMQGFRLKLLTGQVQSFGRAPGKSVCYPDKTVGVSRNQCTVLRQSNGTVYVRDDNSRYGTAINGHRIPPGVWQSVKYGDTIAFGREKYLLCEQ